MIVERKLPLVILYPLNMLMLCSCNYFTCNITLFVGLGNPRGNENPFLLTFGIFWYRYHNAIADRIYKLLWDAYQDPKVQEKNEFRAESREYFDEHYDEVIFNEARKWVIATHQVNHSGRVTLYMNCV